MYVGVLNSGMSDSHDVSGHYRLYLSFVISWKDKYSIQTWDVDVEIYDLSRVDVLTFGWYRL